MVGRTKATDWNGLRSHEKGAPSGAYDLFFDPKMSLLRLGKIEVSHRPREGHIADVCPVSKLVV